MSSSSRLVEAENVQGTDRLRRRARQRHVQQILLQAALELSRAELGGPRVDHVLKRLAGLVGRFADLTALGGLEL